MIRRVFVLLGNDCNLQCRYCAQHPISRMAEKQHISDSLIEWLTETARKYTGRFTVTFYGGEPLIYFHDLKEIVERVDAPVSWTVITNGKALTDQMVDFFNDHDVHVAISWDGENVLNTRGFNAFDKRNPLRRRIMRVKNLGFTGVVSSGAYPMEIMNGMQELAQEAYAVTGDYPSANLDLIFDSGIPDRELIDLDLERLGADAKEMCRIYLDDTISFFKKSCIMSYLDARIREVSDVLKNGHSWHSKCGNGFTVFNVDLSGNFYSCHNNRERVGGIESDLMQIYAAAVRTDKVIERRVNRCQGCPAYLICDGGCKLVRDESMDAYCAARVAFFGTILRELWEGGLEK